LIGVVPVGSHDAAAGLEPSFGVARKVLDTGFPMLPQELAASRAKVRDVNGRTGGSGRILVVDDEPSIVEAVATALR
jgi:hypothetical protein